MQAVRSKNLRLDQVAQRPVRSRDRNRRSRSSAECPRQDARRSRPADERQVIIELGDEDIGDQLGPDIPAIDRTRRARGACTIFSQHRQDFLRRTVSTTSISRRCRRASLRRPRQEDAAARRIGGNDRRIEHDAFARSRCVDTGLAAPARLGFLEGRRLAFVAFIRLVGRVGRRHRHFRDLRASAPDCSISRWIFSELGPNFCR